MENQKILLTKERLYRGGTSGCGFNRFQLEVLGVEYPPRKGWIRRLVGTEMTLEQYAKFVSLQGATHGVPRKQWPNV